MIGILAHSDLLMISLVVVVKRMRVRMLLSLVLLPRRLGQLPDRSVDGHVHIAGEDGKAVVAVIGAGVVPRVHLAERNTHLLEDVLLLDPGADQVGLNLLHKLFKLKAGYVVVDQSA